MLARFWAAAVWWVALCLIEALLVGKIDPQETPVGIAIAALATACALGALAASGERYALPLTAVFALPRVLWTIANDSLVLTVVLVRALVPRETQDDHFERQTLDATADSGEAATRRALAVAGICAGPTSIVVDVERVRGALVVHRLR